MVVTKLVDRSPAASSEILKFLRSILHLIRCDETVHLSRLRMIRTVWVICTPIWQPTPATIRIVPSPVPRGDHYPQHLPGDRSAKYLISSFDGFWRSLPQARNPRRTANDHPTPSAHDSGTVSQAKVPFEIHLPQIIGPLRSNRLYRCFSASPKAGRPRPPPQPAPPPTPPHPPTTSIHPRERGKNSYRPQLSVCRSLSLRFSNDSKLLKATEVI